MAARSWAQFDYDLAHPKSRREKSYEELCAFGVNGEVPFAHTLALVPPKSAVEALAAAIFIRVDLDLVSNGSTDLIKREAAERIQQRATSLASWIEFDHKVDRREWRLDFFCSCDSESALIPHDARTLNVNADHDR